ncbi:MAG: ATP-binding cassette domain-containing protein, partial [Gammaproteobacteria bacterium]
LAVLEDDALSYGKKTSVEGLDLRIAATARIGLIGPNGSGKTTLLELILGEIEPDSGTVRRGTGLQVAYFDQLRERLDEEAMLIDTISPGSEWIEIDGRRLHVTGYLGRFLFPPERARSLVKSLSGGERNRLLLARLFARPANLLVLDEPTNDLDIETLELLEELLSEFAGTLLLVSHDRTFLDNVVTQSIVSMGDGEWREYAGGWSDVQAAQARESRLEEVTARPASAAAEPAKARRGGAAGAGAEPAERPAKLTYREQRELEALPARIDALEAEQKLLEAQLADPTSYQSGGDATRGVRERFAAIEAELLEALERWEALESRR